MPLLAYFGPRNDLPLVSILATTVGGMMMFGRRTVTFFRRLSGAIRKSSA